MQRLLIRCYCTSRQSYYEILGLPKTATTVEIKKAFINLSKKYHPDLTGSNEVATKKFVAVKEAYDTLKDTDKRREYDYQRSWEVSSHRYPYQRNQSNPYKSGDQYNRYQTDDYDRSWWENFHHNQNSQKTWKESFKAREEEERKKYIFSWEKFFDWLPLFAVIIIALIRIKMRISSKQTENLDECINLEDSDEFI